MRHIFVSAAIAAFATSTLGAQSASVRRGDGLRTAEFDSKHGKIRVYLPDDMAAGDVISGTVALEPAGRTEKDRTRNSAVLTGYVVELRDQEQRVVGRLERVAILAGTASLQLVLRDGKGRDVGAVPIKLAPQASAAPALPRVVQASRPGTITGPFDGDHTNTKIYAHAQGTAESTPMKILAESSRGAVVQVPSGTVGPVTYRIEEPGVQRNLTYHSLQVSLTASRLDLVRGERTEVAVSVAGLEGFDLTQQPLAVRVTNLSPAVISIGRTDELALPLVRDGSVGDRVDAGSVPVQSLEPGGFSIGATIVHQAVSDSARLVQANYPPPQPPGAGVDDGVPVDMSGLKEKDLRDEARISDGRLRSTLCDLRLRLKYSDQQGGHSSAWLRERIGWVEREFVRRGLTVPSCE